MSQKYDTLFIGASFFGYAKAIVAELDERGHRTIWFEDRPGVDTLTKSLVRLSPSLMMSKIESYFDGIIEQLRSQPIRHVFVIKGEALSVAAIDRLRAAFPAAKFTLYFWDSYRNMPNGSAEKVALFDRAFTFDPVDAQADQRLTYRPLFFLPDFTNLSDQHRDIDILFIGTIHSDRSAVLKKIEKAIPPELRFAQILYYRSSTLYQVERFCHPWLRQSSSTTTIFTPLTRPEVVALIARANVIVDIERSVQTGYTIRTIETVAAGRKLITTNPRIQNADFYHPSNHVFIDRHNPKIKPEFFSDLYEETPEEIVTRYSLSGWLDDIFDDQPKPYSSETPDVYSPFSLEQEVQ